VWEGDEGEGSRVRAGNQQRLCCECLIQRRVRTGDETDLRGDVCSNTYQMEEAVGRGLPLSGLDPASVAERRR
jgi:hypothetical protein